MPRTKEILHTGRDGVCDVKFTCVFDYKVTVGNRVYLIDQDVFDKGHGLIGELQDGVLAGHGYSSLNPYCNLAEALQFNNNITKITGTPEATMTEITEVDYS